MSTTTVRKVVFSRTLEAASTTRTRIERDFDPAARAITPLTACIDAFRILPADM